MVKTESKVSLFSAKLLITFIPKVHSQDELFDARQHTNYRIHALDVEVESAQSKLRQKDRTIDVSTRCHSLRSQPTASVLTYLSFQPMFLIQDLRDTNGQLKKEMNKLTDKVQNLSSSLSVMQELLAEKDKEIDRKDEMIRCKKTEVKVGCLVTSENLY